MPGREPSTIFVGYIYISIGLLLPNVMGWCYHYTCKRLLMLCVYHSCGKPYGASALSLSNGSAFCIPTPRCGCVLRKTYFQLFPSGKAHSKAALFCHFYLHWSLSLLLWWFDKHQPWRVSAVVLWRRKSPSTQTVPCYILKVLKPHFVILCEWWRSLRVFLAYR